MRWPPERWVGFLAWVLVLLGVAIRIELQPGRNSVYPIFATAGEHWSARQDLYAPPPEGAGLDRFRYAPLVAAAFVPWSWLPLSAAEILWRATNAAILLVGFVRFARVVAPEAHGTGWLSLLLLPLCLPSLNNGQANPLVIGCLLLALTAAMRSRWSGAALWLIVPILFKLYPLALALLLVLLVPKKLCWRLTLGVVAGLLLPFALQDPDYVASQYRAWLGCLAGEDRRSWPLASGYRDFHLLLRLIGLNVSARPYLFMQLAAAAGAAGVVLWGRQQGWPRLVLLRVVLDFGCLWMTLFGPATESCTYTLLAPTLVLAVREAGQRSVWTRLLLLAMVALFLGSLLITALPGGKQVAFFLSPLAALLLLGERLGSLPFGPAWREIGTDALRAG